MNIKTQRHRGIAAVVAILALFHAQVIFACASAGVLDMHSCCPTTMETHSGDREISDDHGAQCGCDQSMAATVEGVFKKSEKPISLDPRTQWDIPFAFSNPKFALSISYHAAYSLVPDTPDFDSGSRIYLETKRLRI